jgi:predicted ferric reductase
LLTCFNPPVQLFARFDDEYVLDWAASLIGFIAPTLIASSVAALFLTSAKLPSWRFSWFNKFFALLRGFGPSCFSRLRAKVLTCFRGLSSDADYGHDVTKKNQFAIGEPNFNVMAMWVALPVMLSVVAYLPASLTYIEEEEAAEHPEENITKLNLTGVSYLHGWGAALAMAWFLIPVARHSVLLVAMGWSPVHALRLHIWLGYLTFIFVVVHAGLLFIVWFGYDDIPVYEQFIPPKSCWSPNAQNEHMHDDEANATEATIEEENNCSHQFYNLTGLIAFLFLLDLWGSSLNWVRRRNYRMFYILHVVFGTLFLLGCILHFNFMALYFLPSTAYYLASTAPTLVQALASRFRGGVRIERVVILENTGGCVEVHAASNPETNQWLDREPCLFVKLCVPKISLVWHPFTVYKHQADPSTIRFMLRPTGPFTTELARLMPERPITILDGFYRGGDRCLQALQHDHVTIVTGGVAITPFLSMIPAILQALREQEDNFLKKIDFHWSCREAGLEAFVVQEYLNDIISQAKGVLEAFTVTVYRTGEKSLEAGEGSSSSSQIDTSKHSSASLNDVSSVDSDDREYCDGSLYTDHEQDAVGLVDEEISGTLNEDKHAKKTMDEVAGSKVETAVGLGDKKSL